MAKFGEEIRTMLADVAQFLHVTLKTVSLPTAASSHRSSLITKLDALQQQYPQLYWELDEQQSPGVGGSRVIDRQPVLLGANEIKEPAKTGPLIRKSHGFMSNFKKKSCWCVVKRGIFYVFEKHDSKQQTMSFPLQGADLKSLQSGKNEHAFELTQGDQKLTFVASDLNDLNSWLTVLQRESQVTPDERLSVAYKSPHDGDDGAYQEFTPLPAGNSPTTPKPTENTCYDRPKPPQPTSTPGPVPPPTATPPETGPHTAPSDEQSLYDEIPGTSKAPSDKPPIMSPSAAPSRARPPIPPVPSTPHPGGKPADDADIPVLYESPDDIQAMAAAAAAKIVDQKVVPPPAAATTTRPPNEPEPPTSTTPITPAPAAATKPKTPAPQPPSVAHRPEANRAAPGKRESRPGLPVPSPTGGDVGGRSELYVALWDCVADADNELSFKKDDRMIVVSHQYEQFGWLIGQLINSTQSKIVGLVPKEYVEKLVN